MEEGKYTIKEAVGQASLSLAPTPFSNSQVVEVNILIKERTNRLGWAAAGVCLWWDEGSFWRLSLVEAPDLNSHYPELIENFEGRHQAQMEGATRLPYWTGGHIDWQFNHLYRMRLELNEEGIKGEISDPQTGETWWAKYSFEKAPAVREGVVGLWVQGLDVEFGDFNLRYMVKEHIGKKVEIKKGAKGSIAVFKDKNFPGNESADYIAQKLESNGYGITYLDSDDLCGQEILSPENFSLLILPDARYFPQKASIALRSFLRRRGNLLLIGAPSFSNMLFKWQGEWLTDKQLEGKIYQYFLNQPKHIFISFDGTDLSKWVKESNSPRNPVEAELDEGKEGKCLKVSASLPGWGAIGSPPLEASPFLPGDTLTCFWAKGDKQTTQMSVEWREKDGSRWIAVVDLTPEWRFYSLPPSAFLYWKDNPSQGRGFPGDCFNPENARQILFGISDSHTPGIGTGKHTFWVDEVGTQSVPKEVEALPSPGELRPINLETVSPSYKIYPLNKIDLFRTAPEAVFLADYRTKEEIAGFSPVWRPEGRGFNRDRLWRWIPLLSAYEGKEIRGSLLSLLLKRDGGAIVSFQLANPSDIKKSPLIDVLLQVVDRLNGVFLFEGGAEHFLYQMGEEVKLGASLFNLSDEQKTVKLKGIILKGGKIIQQKEREIRIPPLGKESVEWQWKPTFSGENYAVEVELWEKGKLIDKISHPLTVLPPPKPAKKEEFVSVKGSDFYLRGKKWFPKGINYWPSMLGGLDTDVYGSNWLSPILYDPLIIEKDLSILEKLGINMLAAVGADISLVSGEKRVVRNLLDFLHRAEKHKMKVMLYIPANPFNFDESVIRSISKGGGVGEVGLIANSPEVVFRFIKEAGLPNITTIFAYDIAWEPAEFQRAQAGAFNEAWERWLVKNYGSVENAEAEFGVKLPRKEGKVAVPIGLNNTKADAAFLRFFSDYASKRYNAIVRAIKSIDPNHLVSFRGGACGLPNAYFCAHLYSVGVAKHIDFLCPEGYNLQIKGYGNPTPWEDIRKGGLITLYYRFISREKPVIWMEFCGPIWPNGTVWKTEMVFTPKERLEYQKEEEEKYYKMFVESGAKGCAPWWYPGGFRVGENSDAGIINPDWTLRPVAEVIEKYNELFAIQKRKKPDEYITIDFDAHPLDAWDTYSPLYLKIVEEGRTPGLRTEGTGSNSLNVPLVAVGNTNYNGRNPLKYLNSEFNYLEIKDSSGNWKRVEDGDVVEVDGSGEIWCRASVGNIGEAEWISPGNTREPGAVYLICYGDGMEVEVGIRENTPYLKDADIPPFLLFSALRRETKLTFRMEAKGRAFFGESLTIKLIPRAR